MLISIFFGAFLMTLQGTMMPSHWHWSARVLWMACYLIALSGYIATVPK